MMKEWDLALDGSMIQNLITGNVMTDETNIFIAFGNIALFIGYFIIGTLGNRIAVISERVDNLLDACSSCFCF